MILKGLLKNVEWMIAENFVIKGSFFSTKMEDDIRQDFARIKDRAILYFSNRGYDNVSANPIFGNYAELHFEINIPPLKIEKGFLSKFKKDEREPYFEKLKVTRKGTPWSVKLYFTPGKLQEIEGFYVDIISEPAIFYQIDQLGWNIPIDAKEYSFIIYPNTQFVKGFANAMPWAVIKEPCALQQYSKTEISQKMRKYNFVKIADLLEKCELKIEMGNSEDGLTDLRSAIEIFFVDLIKQLGQTPQPQDKVKPNIEILEKMGYLDGKMKGFIIKTIVEGVWNKISDTSTHKREQFSLFDSRLFLSVTEDFFDYFIEKVIRYNSKAQIS